MRVTVDITNDTMVDKEILIGNGIMGGISTRHYLCAGDRMTVTVHEWPLKVMDSTSGHF